MWKENVVEIFSDACAIDFDRLVTCITWGKFQISQWSWGSTGDAPIAEINRSYVFPPYWIDIWLNNNNIDVVAVAQSNNRLLRANSEWAVAKFRRQTAGNCCLFCDLTAVIFSYSKDMESFSGWKMTSQILSNVANYLQPWEFLFLVQFCIVFHQ